MVKIIVKSLSDLKQLIKKFEALQRTMPIIRKNALERAADEALLTDIHREMEAAGISKKIIETTYVGNTEIIDGKVARVHIISDYVPDNGFDVGEAREEGTDDHMIKPVKKKALSWIDPKTGKRIFDPIGHMVSGLPRLLIVERTLLRNESKFADAYFNNIGAAYNQALS